MTGKSFDLSGIALNDLAVWRAVPIEIPLAIGALCAGRTSWRIATVNISA